MKTDGDGNEYTFSYCACGVAGARTVRAHGIGFATMAKLVIHDPLWDAVLDLLRRSLPKRPEPEKPTHLRLVHSAD